jgi:hypothetical protein
MVIVKFQGGIGNQLFEYAFYKQLKHMGKEVYADLSAFRTDFQIRDFELEKLGLTVQEASKKELRKLGQLHETLYDKVMFRLKGRKTTVSDEFGQVFNPIFFEKDNVLLDGYWQTKKYFEDVFEDVVSEIDFERNLDAENKCISEEMGRCESVSVHMRFGDYVGHKLYSGICTQEYYKKAVEHIKAHVGSPKFFVITDDEERAKAVLQDEEFTILNNNRGSDSYKDMYLISSCKHHIMANSSFSWWGVMLDKKKAGIVVSPSVWLNGVDTKDIWEKEWVRV